MSRRRARTSTLTIVLIVILLIVLVALALYLLRSRIPSPAQVNVPGQASPSPVASGPYEVYFTTPTYPDRPENRRGGIDEKFVRFVDAATRTLDVAAYDFDLENVATAMARAKSRGVQVRMVTDTDTVENKDEAVQKALGIVRGAGIEIVPDGRQAIMHNKFAVRDREEVWTGSWNLTTGDTYRLNNNAARMRSPELARAFTDEFELMFVQRKFGGNRPKGSVAAPVQVGAARVQVLFAPEGGVAAKIAQRIALATGQVRFLAFSFTHDGMGKAVKDRAAAGVQVSGVFEKTGSETRFSEYGSMKAAGLDVYQDGNPYVMHHKVFVIDGRVTVFGSFNFSDSADKDNDENCLIVEDPAFASLFLQETDRMLALARGQATPKATPEKERPR